MTGFCWIPEKICTKRRIIAALHTTIELHATIIELKFIFYWHTNGLVSTPYHNLIAAWPTLPGKMRFASRTRTKSIFPGLSCTFQDSWRPCKNYEQSMNAVGGIKHLKCKTDLGWHKKVQKQSKSQLCFMQISATDIK